MDIAQITARRKAGAGAPYGEGPGNCALQRPRMLSDKCENLENAISLLFPSEFLSTSRLDAARAHCRLRVEMRASRMPSLAHILVGQQQDDPYTAGQQDPYALDYWSPRGRSGSEGSPLGDGDGPGGRAGPTWESRAGESAPPHAFQQQFPVRMAGGETRTAPSAQPDPRQPLRETLLSTTRSKNNKQGQPSPKCRRSKRWRNGTLKR